MWYSGSASSLGIDVIREFWICCWISSLLWEVFLQYSDFPLLWRTNTSKYKFNSGMHKHFQMISWELQSVLWLRNYYIYFGCSKFTYAIIYFLKMLVKTGRIVVLIGQNTSRKLAPKRRPRTCLNMWVVIPLPEFFFCWLLEAGGGIRVANGAGEMPITHHDHHADHGKIE